jgi:uncharacterized repeat protein (TIGR03803 family)
MRSKKNFAGGVIALAVVAASLMMVANASAQTESVLFNFGAPKSPGRAGNSPHGNLVMDSQGHLYGTTSGGGYTLTCGKGSSAGCGTVFELGPKVGGGWTQKVLHTFTNNGIDGIGPEVGLTFDAAGNLYGTTGSGGQYGDGGTAFFGGTVFELSPGADGNWTEKILYNFEGGVDSAAGDNPVSPVFFDTAGNLYGTTYWGGPGNGNNSLGCGSVYELVPGAGGTWTETTVHTFLGGDDGCSGLDLILGADGNLYGTAAGGRYGHGLVFEMVPGSGGIWTEEILDDFESGDAPVDPYNLVFDSAGNLYGTAGGDGTYDNGSIFELSPGSNGTWTETIAYRFLSLSEGSGPGGLSFDMVGDIHGVTAGGGAHKLGTIFTLAPAVGGGWTETVVYSFAGGTDGEYPNPPVWNAAGDMFGTTVQGGTYNLGTVYKIVP